MPYQVYRNQWQQCQENKITYFSKLYFQPWGFLNNIPMSKINNIGIYSSTIMEQSCHQTITLAALAVIGYRSAHSFPIAEHGYWKYDK